jgi:hypothetical protein
MDQVLLLLFPIPFFGLNSVEISQEKVSYLLPYFEMMHLSNSVEKSLLKTAARNFSGLAADSRHWKIMISRIPSSHMMVNLPLDV